MHGTFHIADGQQMHHLWGKEAQKVKMVIKIGEKRCIGVCVT